MNFNYNDGGRSNYFKGKDAGDCVARSIAIATGKDYKEVYDALNELAKTERRGTKKRGISNARTGVYRRTYERYLNSIGWEFKPLMLIGSGCKVHLSEDDIKREGLDYGAYVLSLSGHLTALVDGVIQDTHNPSREGTRCVYGYYYKSIRLKDKYRLDDLRATRAKLQAKLDRIDKEIRELTGEAR